MSRFELHGCTQNLSCPKTGLLIKKPFLISTNSPELARTLNEPTLKCQGGHNHGEVMGGNSTLTGRYTPKFARLVLQALAWEHNAPCAPAPVLVDNPFPPHVAQQEESRLRKSAASIEHLMTHLPFNPLCPHCVKAKQKRSQHRRAQQPRAKAKYFWDVLRGDHIFGPEAETGDTCALILTDDCRVRKGIAAFPGPSPACLRGFLQRRSS